MALGVIELISGDADAAARTARDGRGRISEDNEWGRVVIDTAVASFGLLSGRVDRPSIAAAVQRALRVGNPTMIVNSQFVAVVDSWRADPKGAARDLDECIALTEAGAAAPTLGHMLSIRSVLSALDGDRFAAVEQLHHAVRFSHVKGDLPMLSCAFEYGLQTLAILGHDDAATVFTGFARSPLMALVTNLPDTEVPNRDRAVADLRERVGPDVFDLEVARAADLPLDDAVTASLSILDRLAADAHP